jgi:glycosyltransferase involved in cell wall biosynthesis
MAAGKPVIANPVGDIAWIIKKYKIGLCIEYSLIDVADKKLFLLNKPKLIKQSGINARKTAEKYYNREILSKKLNHKYEEVKKLFF